MTSEQFAYWMQGFVELNGASPTDEQWQSIKDHLATVFVKVTPTIGPIIASPALPPGSNWPRQYGIQTTCSTSRAAQ